jgi:hypothetical protein
MTVVTDRRWLVASDENGDPVTIVSAPFEKTLLVEMAIVLLAGHLKIDFESADAKPSTVVVEFNTVMAKLYQEATNAILAGIENGAPGPVNNSPVAGLFNTWPLKFQNTLANHIPGEDEILAATYWPSVTSGFQRELAPAAALIATNRDLLLISDESASFWARAKDATKLGSIFTYFPLARLGEFHFSNHERLGHLDLGMHAIHGGEKLHVLFPAECESAVRKVIERAMEVRKAISP